VKLEKTIGEELETLGKKAKYLEKQFNEANSQLRDIVSCVPAMPVEDLLIQ
jgi:prefoldin subunit 1